MMKLREATASDAPRVRELIFEVLQEYGLKPDPTGTDADLVDLHESYFKRGGVFEVLENESGEIVGSVALFPLSKDVCELRKMYLRKTARGKGAGRRLLEHALGRARELGFKTVELETASVLKEAISLYVGYGFKPIQREHLASRCDQVYALDL